ncbi:MAG: hypothetical protein O9274_05450 [Limnobacter sp.]|uniref:tetratricopeptide repeat protein n=1 Tax=Limnobacter sp. TaxID=2003368 RepID=UPI0022BE3F8B|nr:hypothetical protein [Limnobacter sp.]MCZ8015128.1 hypothetical protein [Limnobacter sp.]
MHFYTLSLKSWCRLLGAASFLLLAFNAFATQADNQSDQGMAVYKALLPKAEAGDPEVQTTLGLMRLRGDTVPRDLRVARVWLGKAAIQQHTPAQYYLGQLLLLDVFNANPSDLDKQLTEGLGWLRRASRDQHPQSQLLYAQTLLGSQLDDPFGHSKIEAQQHLNSCAEVHLPCTRYALSRLDQGKEEEYCPSRDACDQKRRLLYTLANAEDAHARYRLSKFEGEDRMFWLRRAARLAHPQASYELADLVIRNEAPLQPEDPAVLSLLSSAAQQDVPQAMHLLGSMLVEGTRFPVNKPLGIQWLKLSAEKGFEPSRQLLMQIQTTADSKPAAEQVESAQTPENKP